MRREELLSAISGIDDKYIVEADIQSKRAHRFSLKRLGAFAACLILALAVTIGAIGLRLGLSMGGASGDIPESPQAPDKAPSMNDGDNLTDDFNNGVAGEAVLLERVENEAGYLIVEEISDNQIKLRLRLNNGDQFGILYLEEFADNKMYTEYGSLGESEWVKHEGYERSECEIGLLVNGERGSIPTGEEITLTVTIPTLIEGNEGGGILKIRLGKRIVEF